MDVIRYCESGGFAACISPASQCLGSNVRNPWSYSIGKQMYFQLADKWPPGLLLTRNSMCFRRVCFHTDDSKFKPCLCLLTTLCLPIPSAILSITVALGMADGVSLLVAANRRNFKGTPMNVACNECRRRKTKVRQPGDSFD